MKRTTSTISDENWKWFLRYKVTFITTNERDINFTEFVNWAMDVARNHFNEKLERKGKTE